jgi:kumamolisin
MTKISLSGSKRDALVDARVIGAANPTERLEVSIIVRRRAATALRKRVAALAKGNGNGARTYLSRDEFAGAHGADPTDLALVRSFASANGLHVVEESAARRTIVLSGTVAQMNAAFDVKLQNISHPSGTFRGRSGTIQVPANLEGVVEAVLGLDNRPQAKPYFRTRPSAGNVNWHVPKNGSVSFEPPQVASLYNFPKGSGAGQCVALIELGGGFRPEDLNAYFAALKVPSPTVSAVSVDHGKNAPTGDPNGPDGEVMLDVEVVGAIAPKATVAVYFAPNTDAGFLDAITTAIHDTAHKPSVISISWGGPESSWTAQALTAMDEAFQDAAALGITICAASGDNGSSDGVGDGSDHVDFPASSPHALACGGTRLQVKHDAIASETVWNDGNAGASGGGVSSVFGTPAWQSGIKATDSRGIARPLVKRGVPDVCGNADPATGYVVRIDGTNAVIGGTSAVAPLWAALIARINEARAQPAGYINPLIYEHPSALRDVTHGTNGDYEASVGWDACTGVGSPNGAALASVLSA